MKGYQLTLCVIGIVLSAGCSNLNSQNRPDVIYSDNAPRAQALQVPPDLTDISNTQQFVVPGTSGEAVTRNTLLPQFDDVSFVREGGQSWLAFQQTPEDLWPQLLAFLRDEQYRINQTEPVAGVIVSQWRPASSVSRGGLLSNLVSDSDAFSRVAFRLERADTGARLFARSQAVSEESIEDLQDSDNADWPASSHDPENTSELLNRFLVFLGVEAQRVQGIFDGAQTSAVFDDAFVQTSASGSEMIVNRGFQVSFREVIKALEALDYNIVSRDDSAGIIGFTLADSSLSIQLSPIHVGAVRVSLSDEQGAKLSAEREQQILSTLADQLA